MEGERKIVVVISAEDDYSAKLRKFNEAIGGTAGAVNQASAATMSWTDFLRGRMGPAMKEFGSHGEAIKYLSEEYKRYKTTGVAAYGAVSNAAGGLGVSTDRLSSQLSKLGSVNDFASGQIIRLRGIMQTMAFGVIIGAVSAFTDEMIKQYKATTISKEKIDELNKSVMDQARTWKLLPGPINSVTKATTDLYNAQLLYDQYLERNKGKELERQIELTEKAKKMRQEAMGKVVGPLAASIRETWKTEILEADVTLAELNKKLDAWHELMKLKTVDNVSSISAAAKEALKAPEGTNFLTAFIAGDFAYAAKKVEFDGLVLGETYVAAVKWGIEKKKAELGVGAFVFSMPEIKTPTSSPVWFPPPPQMDAHVAAFNQMEDLQNAFGVKSRGYYDELIAMHAKYGDDVIKQELKKSDLQIYLAKNSFAYAANTMQNLFVATGKHNRAMFEIGKGFAIAQTAIDTYQASMAAYKALSGIPIIGPALGATAAASIIATGLARVREISSTQPGGGSISSGGSANPSYSGGSPEAYPIPQRTEEKPVQNITLNIYNPLSEQNWAKIAEDNIVPAINAAGDRNIKININAISTN